ncbi:ABC transporter ATP-binding protein [Ruminococcus sp. NK3A76]|uniref:ABC transporter ATP-binding protein n=1 Tax=Ruminococcus sp. NK3A76 TaxID=877411 RepID=UPI00055EB16F|nr:ABC transporter ATP-binding protein [Ruminococcus sp. NK3A76]
MLIEAKDLCKYYGKGEGEVKALDNACLSIDKGEMTAIVGTSGAGKSTLLHLLGGLDKPSSGVVRYEGENIFDYSEHKLARFRLKKIGFVFQFFGLVPELTAWNNIILPAGLNRNVDKEYIRHICETLGISERLIHYPSQLSGGQQQRVAIARALANKPSVLLCDEPTGNLDEASGKEVMELLARVRREYGQTVIIITHDSSIAGQCGRIIKINDGKLTENG